MNGIIAQPEKILNVLILTFMIVSSPVLLPRDAKAQERVQIPSHTSSARSKGRQGRQRTEVHFDPSTNTVTIKFLVQDPNGYFIPNIHPGNFAVYEDGVRQHIESVDVEHAPVSFGLLLEFGGRSQTMNQIVATQDSDAGHQLLHSLSPQDKVAVWSYADKVQKLTDFTQDHQSLDQIFYSLGTPNFSETNLYDAIIFTVGQMHRVRGRKAVILVSTGVDTFSHATLQDALNFVGNSDVPVYVISINTAVRQAIETGVTTGPLTHIDWTKAEQGLEKIAEFSGGRTYGPENSLGLSAAYDDMMENLKVRYVIRYRSSSNRNPELPRSIRIALVDSNTGAPLRFINANGKATHATVVAKDRYIPAAAASR